MSELIEDPKYWARRLREAPPNALHHAIFKCPTDQWLRIEAKHREILSQHIMFADSVLDAGCGWGRLLTLMPENWGGYYVGLDLSPDFIDMAQSMHPSRDFAVYDLTKQLVEDSYKRWFDWGILISIRPMIKRHLGEETWAKIEGNLRDGCKRLLYLEYDESDSGSVE